MDDRTASSGASAPGERALRERVASLEQQVAELGNACVVMERLHGALDRAGVLAAIEDVVINVIGSEELAIFELVDGGRALRPVRCFGVDAAALGSVPWGAGAVGRAAAERRIWAVPDRPAPDADRALTAVAPLCAGPSLGGVVAIWRMLPHKAAFGPADRAVLELLSRHAGVALHLTAPGAPSSARAA